MSADLLLRYFIISIAIHIACAWIQTFQSPWPLVDAFELAGTAEEQLFKSLGIRFASLPIILILLKLLKSEHSKQLEHNVRLSSLSTMKEMQGYYSKLQVSSS